MLITFSQWKQKPGLHNPIPSQAVTIPSLLSDVRGDKEGPVAAEQ